MTALREKVASELAGKVERYGVVVWDDPTAAFASIAQEVAPAGSHFHRHSGSWFQLRSDLEALLAGAEPPALVVYLSEQAPDPDPLEEIHALGTTFRQKLGTLLAQVMSDQLPEHRIAELAAQCNTLDELEAALDGGESSVDARLISVVGKGGGVDVLVEILGGRLDAKIDEAELWGAVVATAETAAGLPPLDRNGAELRQKLIRHVLLACLGAAVGTLPDELADASPSVSNAQRRCCTEIIERLQGRGGPTAEYAALAHEADTQLHLGTLLQWQDELRSADVVPSIDDLALDACIRHIEEAEFERARLLASHRLASSWWMTSAAPDGGLRRTRFSVVEALARLADYAERMIPPVSSLKQLGKWYASAGWQVDAAYRSLEQRRMSAGDALGDLDDLFVAARQSYESWLDEVLQLAADAMSSPELENEQLQRSIHHRYVEPGGTRTAYVLVDALRYELGVALAERLGSIDGAEIGISAAFATPPTITPVGMAAVLPGADTDFLVELNSAARLDVAVAGAPMRGVADRVKALGNAHGQVADFLLDDVAQLTAKELKKKIGEKSLVLVRSTEIDADGETDQLAASWNSFDSTLSLLQTAVAKLIHAGIERVVLTADHGFLAVRQLGEDRRIDKPSTGTGELHRRAWIGRGGTATPSTVKVPLASFGIASDLDIITPRGLGVFKAGGGLQFFHGGLSPQELVVPVITVSAGGEAADPSYTVTLAVAGGRISNAIFAVTLDLVGDLFTSESQVRLQLTFDGQEAAKVLGGDGFDTGTDTIAAGAFESQVVTMQVTANLKQGSTAKLEVLDAQTGIRLGSIDVEIAGPVIVEDEL